LYLAAASAVWSSTPVFARVAYSEGLGPMQLVEVRLALGAALLWVFLGREIDMPALRQNFREVLILSVLGLGANFYLYHLGLFYTTAQAAQVLESTSPLVVLVLAVLLREERVSWLKAAAVGLSVSGSLTIFAVHVGSVNLYGDFLEVLAAVSWGVFVVLGSRILRGLNPASVLFGAFGVSAVLFLPLALGEPAGASREGVLVGAFTCRTPRVKVRQKKFNDFEWL